jgi:trans-aconitate methyltransferase
MMNLKREVFSYSPEEYRQLYANLDSISRNRATDLNGKCLSEIASAVEPRDRVIVDVGCGSGFLLHYLAERFPDRSYTGIDVVKPARAFVDSAKFIEADATTYSFDEGQYDMVLCCHVLEHLLDYRTVVRRLVAAARHKVLFVVPKQRPYRYTLDEHVNFFLFPEQFAHEVGLPRFRLAELDGDLLYVGYKS